MIQYKIIFGCLYGSIQDLHDWKKNLNVCQGASAGIEKRNQQNHCLLASISVLLLIIGQNQIDVKLERCATILDACQLKEKQIEQSKPQRNNLTSTEKKIQNRLTVWPSACWCHCCSQAPPSEVSESERQLCTGRRRSLFFLARDDIPRIWMLQSWMRACLVFLLQEYFRFYLTINV